MADWTHNRQVTASNLTISTRTSGVDAASEDIELGVRSRRESYPGSEAPTSDGEPRPVAPALNIEWKRAREFKGRQIQMMAFGSFPQMQLTEWVL
jgi:hypothetical protein